MAERKIVPDIRFAGFGGDWERQKAADLAEYSKGQGYSKSDLTESGTPIILYGRLYTRYKFLIDDVDTFAVAKSGSVFSQGGEVIVPASGETADDIARASAVAKPGILLGGDLNILRPVEQMNPVFLAISLSNGASREELARKAQGKSVVHIHNSDIQEISVSFPARAEQDRIADGFMRLDGLIESMQHKLIALANFKKAMLDKMFPKDGAAVPEIRFNGFSGDWEQRKLGDTASSFEYGLNAAAKEYDGINKYLRITDIDDSSRAFKSDDLTSPDADFSISDSYRLRKGDVLFARTGASVGKTYIYRETDGLVYFAGFLIRASIKHEYDAEFIFQNTLTSSYEKFIQITSQRSGQPGVNAQEYAEYSFLTPNYAEQKKIGGFLRQIDNLIVFHQRKLDCLRNIKEACLEKMFV